MTNPHSVRAIAPIFGLLMAFACFMTGVNAQPQSAYPVKNVRIVVGFAAGGFADSVSRLVGQKLSERLGQPVVVENRGGAGGNIGAKFVVNAAPDGYTLLAHTAASTINNSLYKNIGFNLLSDLVPIANVGSSPGIFAVNASHKAGSLEDLIRMTKASGGRLTYSTAGVGTSSHLAAEYLFNTLSGLQATHIPFQGGAQAISAVMSGQVDVVSISLPPASAFLKNGTLKALAVSSLKRVDTLPNVRSASESGFSDFEERSWVGFFAPANTPSAIVNRLNAEISHVVALPEVRDRLLAMGIEPQISTAADFVDYVRKEVNMWSKIVSTTGITLD